MTKILNIGCGARPSAHPDVVNIDWSIYLVIKTNPVLRLLSRVLVTGERRRVFESLPDSIRVVNLRKGLPFADASADAAYHSHFLEHLDAADARSFVAEVRRVLKPGGVHRIVVPDMAALCARYLAHVQACRSDPAEIRRHDAYVAAIIEQMVRREASGTARQKPWRRRIENLLLGDARRRGETHQWMYDEHNLRALLAQAGYREIEVAAYDRSRIPGWEAYGLDRNADGSEYKPGSLYMEAVI